MVSVQIPLNFRKSKIPTMKPPHCVKRHAVIVVMQRQVRRITRFYIGKTFFQWLGRTR